MFTLEFTIPDLPLMPNAMFKTRAWQIKKTEREKWHRLVMLVTAGKRPLKPLTRCRLTAVRHGHGRPDFDGLVGSFKFCADALTRLGIIEDDSMDVILERDYSWVYARPENSKVTIKLEEL